MRLIAVTFFVIMFMQPLANASASLSTDGFYDFPTRTCTAIGGDQDELETICRNIPRDSLCNDKWWKQKNCYLLAAETNAFRYDENGDLLGIDLWRIDDHIGFEETLIILPIFLIIISIVGFFIIRKLLRVFFKKSSELYQSSSLPLKNKLAKRKVETELRELDEVKPAEQNYQKASFKDNTEEIEQINKLERKIKIKELEKKLKSIDDE